MSESKKEGRGGARIGSGRPKGEKHDLIRVPESLIPSFKEIIKAYRINQRKLEEKEGR
jgi:hypothetical protein